MIRENTVLTKDAQIGICDLGGSMETLPLFGDIFPEQSRYVEMIPHY